MQENKLRDQICELGRSIFDRGLTHGSTGNISARCEDGWLLTPTGSSLGRLEPSRLSKLDWNGKHLSGDPPSKENFLHLAMAWNKRRELRLLCQAPTARGLEDVEATHSHWAKDRGNQPNHRHCRRRGHTVLGRHGILAVAQYADGAHRADRELA